jgi:hypothetical protein
LEWSVTFPFKYIRIERSGKQFRFRESEIATKFTNFIGNFKNKSAWEYLIRLKRN